MATKLRWIGAFGRLLLPFKHYCPLLRVPVSLHNWNEPVCSRWYHVSSCEMGKANRSKFREPILHKPKSKKPLVKVWNRMTVGNLAEAMEVDVDYIFECLLHTEYADIYTGSRQEFEDVETIMEVVRLAGKRPEIVPRPSKMIGELMEDKDVYKRPILPSDRLVPRPPVVTILGHVDHGKTTLLDAFRHSQIVETEFGGITQHIGAFVVRLPKSDRSITFLDTPGHAAFKNMRLRGALVTDIVVLVVAADDGVMDQTVESIRFAREAKVPMVIAINKCDKYESDVDRTKRNLMAQNIELEDYGGDVQSVCISALKGTNIDALQEAILTQAELLDLKGDQSGLAEGHIIESRTTQGKGKLSTVLVKRGTLKKGSYLVAGTAWCKVRALYDEFGNQIQSAGPSFPAEVSGWREELPAAGDEVLEVPNEKRLKEVLEFRLKKEMEKKAESDAVVIEAKRDEHNQEYRADRQERLDLGYRRKMRRQIVRTKEAVETHTGPKLSIVVKGDVDGSIDAIMDVLATYHSDKCQLDVVSVGVGPVTVSDVEVASLFKAVIFCFNTGVLPDATAELESKSVELRHFNIIYALVDNLKLELSKQLPMADKEEILGEGLVLKEFLISDRGRKKAPVAGCLCKRGTLSRKQKIRFIRDGEVYFDGDVVSMKREKEVVSAVTTNQEVGVVLEDKSIRFQPDDQVICYQVVRVEQKIDWSPPGF